MRKWIALGLGGLLLAGCEEPTRTELRGSVAVSFATRAPVPPPAPPLRAVTVVDTQVTGTDTLIILSAQMVLREIELRTVEADACGLEPEPAGCEEIEIGPELVDLPLSPGAAQRFSVDVPPGMYSNIEFDVHKVESGDPLDDAFLLEHPELAGLSIRVLGTFNSQTFVYESDLNADYDLDVLPVLNVIEGADVNLTVRVDIDTWFRTAGGALIDPATANKGGANEDVVEDNIIVSLKAFEDDDRDGDDTD